MLQVAVGWGGSGDSRWQDWGFVFGTSKGKKASAVAEVVKITLDRNSAPNEICGVVQQLFKTKLHNGILIELVGTLRLGPKEYSLLSPLKKGNAKRPPHSSKIYQHICSPKTTISTTAYQKFPFKLTLPEPEDLNIPPSFESKFASVEYKLVVLIKINENYKFLGEKIVHYCGQLSIESSWMKPMPLRKDVTSPLGSLRGYLEIQKKAYLSTEDIHFNIGCCDKEHGSVKKISVSLLQVVKTLLNGEERVDSRILDCVTFKRFLKREEFTRSGKFKGRIPTGSYFGEGSYGLTIQYVIQVKFGLKNSQDFSNELEVIIGTDEHAPVLIPSAPSELGNSGDRRESESSDQASAPNFDQIVAPSAPMQGLSLAASLLSLLPPAYSQLPSRSGSIVSLETLPPHYDDLKSN